MNMLYEMFAFEIFEDIPLDFSICSGYIDKAKDSLQSGSRPPGREASILTSMLTTPDIDPRDVKMTMIDFIAAGIDNVSQSFMLLRRTNRFLIFTGDQLLSNVTVA